MRTRSKSIARAPWLEEFLGDDIQLETGEFLTPSDLPTLSGRVEEGLIAYGRHPDFGHCPLSLVLDRTGIHYDTTRSSDLQRILKTIRDGWSEGMAVRARRLIARIKNLHLTKYNFQEGRLEPGRWRQHRVLIVDQSIGSRALGFLGAKRGLFEQMMDSACRSFAETEILVKLHPDHELYGKSSILHGYIPPGVSVVPQGVNIWSVLDNVDIVYTVSSQVGLEALMAGRKVVCFGRPFYAGWGLTTDLAGTHRETESITLEQLFYGILIKYSVYLHPETRERCEIEDILSYLESALKKSLGFYKAIYTVGLKAEQRKVVTPFLQGHFAREVRHLSAEKARGREFGVGEAALFWGESERFDDDQSYLANRGVTVLRARSWAMPLIAGALDEPSLLQISKHRSFNLGDFDSYLTQLLQDEDLSQEILRRSEALQQLFIAAMNQKNEAIPESILRKIGERSVALVLGHHDSDDGLGTGEKSISTDYDLLEKVRRDFPDAYLIYLPRMRHFTGSPEQLSVRADLCDYIARSEEITSSLKLADTVHVISSLYGVQALMCGKMVYTYGRPFYAGYGLTQDFEELKERKRQRSMPELLAVALILGPTYLDWQTQSIATPEAILRRLLLPRGHGGYASNSSPPSSGLRKIRVYFANYWSKIGGIYQDLVNWFRY